MACLFLVVSEGPWSTPKLGPGMEERCLCMAGLPGQGDFLTWLDCCPEGDDGSLTQKEPLVLKKEPIQKCLIK